MFFFSEETMCNIMKNIAPHLVLPLSFGHSHLSGPLQLAVLVLAVAFPSEDEIIIISY